MDPKLTAFADLIQTVHRLRAPGGCPWDRAQTHQSLRPYLIEEAYEVLDALDRVHSTEDLKRDEVRLPFREELGDLLMQVVLHAEMASETAAFDIYDVARGLNEKLIRRHPHVFGETPAESADAAVANWEKQKQKEKAEKKDASVLEGLPKGMPSLQRAGRVIEKVTRVGFQWPDLQGPLAKIEEELQELKVEVLALEKATGDLKEQMREKVASEIGDLLFTVANVAYLSKIHPEDALRGQLQRFESRFRHIEKRARECGKELEKCTLDEMDAWWDEAKRIERQG
jgi:tetrapyrrole methylase family protein/MazG family protein